MVGKSVSEKLAEKKAEAANDGFEKIVVSGGDGAQPTYLAYYEES